MQAEDVEVELRLSVPSSGPLKAFADVTLSFGSDGEISLYGFSLMGEPIQIIPPARSGKQRYFDTVKLSGNIKRLILSKIAAAYQEAISGRQGGTR